MIFTFTPLIWGAGTDILSLTERRRRSTRRRCAKPLRSTATSSRKIWCRRVQRTDNGANFLSITNGKIGQQSLGAFSIGTLVTQHPEINFGVSLIPSIDGKPSSFAGGDNFVVTKGTKKLSAVKGFLEYVYSLEGQKIMAKYGSLPTRGDLANEVLADLDPRMKVGVDAIAVAKTPYTLQFNDLINSANGPWAAFTHAAILWRREQSLLGRAKADAADHRRRAVSLAPPQHHSAS